MIFPSYPDETTTSSKLGEIAKEIAWDFESNAPVVIDGEIQIVEGEEALKVWIQKALYTERFKWPIYKWSYGSEIVQILEDQLLGMTLYEAIKETIVDTLVYHPNIRSVENFEFDRQNDFIRVAFEVITELDDKLEVSILV